jgi:hypothetical protein
MLQFFLEQTQPHAIRAMEPGDHSKNGASPKSLMIRRNFLIKMLAVLCLFLVVSCGDKDNGNDINLAKNVDGKDLTEEFCINLVRNYWDCNKGASNEYHFCSGGYNYSTYACIQGDEGKLMNQIVAAFEEGILTTKSYYRNYRLNLETAGDNGCDRRIVSIAF